MFFARLADLTPGSDVLILIAGLTDATLSLYRRNGLRNC